MTEVYFLKYLLRQKRKPRHHSDQLLPRFVTRIRDQTEGREGFGPVSQ